MHPSARSQSRITPASAARSSRSAALDVPQRDESGAVRVPPAPLLAGCPLANIAARISDFGFTPNRVAALGENLILLANLAGSAWLYAAFLGGRKPFRTLEAWQMGYLLPATPGDASTATAAAA